MDMILLPSLLVLAIIIAVQQLLIQLKLNRQRTVDVAAVLREEFRASRRESGEEARGLREEISKAQKDGRDSVIKAVSALGQTQQQALTGVEGRVKTLADSNDAKLDKLRGTVEEQLKAMRTGNEEKLEKMRLTVDEKLQSTLERRLGESFKLVSERLEAVQKGLGEMKSLAADVGGLKRVLINVKAKGIWAEYQLGDILEQMLAPDQYGKDVCPKPNSRESVEFAVRLPGPNDDTPVWLPIDAKFPQQDYQRLLDASEAGDANGVKTSAEALIRSVETAAKDISEKYIEPPHTTDFGIMFLPTEGLYAEVLRQPGLVESLQQKHRIVVTGPTTLSATLSSLRMGFRTLAIEKRSSEVWEVLSAVKTEFGKFGNVLSRVKKQLNTASNTIEDTERRTRAMERKLRSVESLPEDEARKLLEQE